MSTLNNLPWQRIKGPRTRRRKCNYNKLRKIPNAFTKDSLVKLKTNFDIPGKIQVYDTNTAGTAVVSSMYRPLVIDDTEVVNSTSGATYFASSYKWNDGIVTGNLSHYLQPPSESKMIEGSGRAAVSNVMLGGKHLFGGGMIGYGWDTKTQRQFSASPDASSSEDTKALYMRYPIAVVNGTRKLHLHSYSLHLKETPWVNMHTIQDQKGIDGQGDQEFNSANIWRSFPLCRNDAMTGVQFSSIPADMSTIGTSTMEMKQMLHKSAKVKVRNLLIRLPPEPIVSGSSAENTLGTRTLQLGPILNGGSIGGGTTRDTPWQQLVWDEIKKDFFLVGDHKFGPPTGWNQDLYARINPKYTVLQETYTTIGMHPQVGKPPTPRYHHISHAFSSKYGTDHDVTNTAVKFKTTSADIEEDDLTAIEVNTVPGDSTVDQITNIPSRIEVVAATTRGVKRAADGSVLPTDPDEGMEDVPDVTNLGYQSNPSGTDAIPTWVSSGVEQAKGQVSLQSIDDVNPTVLYPCSNRLVWIRIPRMADASIELPDLVAGNKQYPLGSLDLTAASEASQSSKNLLLSALTQLCSCIQGNTTYKFINPTVMGNGSATPPSTFIQNQFTGSGPMLGLGN